ncbi:MAG: hypothetical protein M0D55_08875 [Elusimicrobiota bacterium]|nr:MAG: hypothetical protein M0D55_08875 [Elusimicrobiota bacterium]
MSRGRAWAAAALALGAFFAVAAATSVPFDDNWGHAEVESGELLLHGRTAPRFNVSFSMPLTSVAAACLFGHWGLEGGRLLWAALLAGVHVLAASLALAAGGWAAAAAALALVARLSWAWDMYPMNTLYAAGFLLAAGLLVRREREPDVSNGLLLGLGVALSVLLRSPLVFFPFVLLAADLARPRSSRPGAAAALAPCSRPPSCCCRGSG